MSQLPSPYEGLVQKRFRMAQSFPDKKKLALHSVAQILN